MKDRGGSKFAWWGSCPNTSFSGRSGPLGQVLGPSKEVFRPPPPTNFHNLPRISLAALLVNVTARIREGCTPCAIRFAMRCVKVFVFPDPAPAKISRGPSRYSTASFCLSFNPFNISSITQSLYQKSKRNSLSFRFLYWFSLLDFLFPKRKSNRFYIPVSGVISAPRCRSLTAKS